VGIAGTASKNGSITYTTLGRILTDCQIAQMVSFHQFRGTIDKIDLTGSAGWDFSHQHT